MHVIEEQVSLFITRQVQSRNQMVIVVSVLGHWFLYFSG